MAAHRYWRITLATAAAAAYAFAEVQFRITAGVSLAFSGGTASARDVWTTAVAANAADSNITTYYSSNDKTPPQWWAYDFGATSGNWRDVVEIAITARNDSNYTQTPTNFYPEWSDDGSAWTTMRSVVASWTSAGQVQTFAVTPAPPLVNTSWNPADSTAFLTLSNSNLTATVSNGNQGVRAANGQVTGKFYFEVTATTWTGLQPFLGIANSSANLGSIGATPTNGCGVISNGNIYLNGAQATGNPSLGARANGDIIGVAIDAGGTLAWFRVAPSGNWNGNAGYAPGGTGGVNFSAIGGASTPVYPIVSAVTAGAIYTANFGDSAFSGAVPAGYTSGWTIAAGGGASATTQARAMVLA